MNISAPFIRRPVATSLLTVALLLAGRWPIECCRWRRCRRWSFRRFGVNAGLPGASPETMASAVATPLERQFGRIAGITQMTSTSQSARRSIVLQFDLNRNIDAAARDVQAAINAARGQLPANLPSNPSWRKVNPADAPILILALTSDTATQPQMYDVARFDPGAENFADRGNGPGFVGGSSLPAVRVEVNPMQLSKLGVGIEQVRTALRTANANAPKGAACRTRSTDGMLHDNDQLFHAAQYAPLIVAYQERRAGAAVRCSDGHGFGGGHAQRRLCRTGSRRC